MKEFEVWSSWYYQDANDYFVNHEGTFKSKNEAKKAIEEMKPLREKEITYSIEEVECMEKEIKDLKFYKIRLKEGKQIELYKSLIEILQKLIQ